MRPDALPVAAVVVNLDGGPLLDACLDALEAQRAAAIVVVDNGSARGEVERLFRRRGTALVRLPRNGGFAGPANRGVEEAVRAAAVPYVAIINNDAVLEPEYLAACVAELDADAGLAAAQGVVLQGSTPLVDGWGLGWNERGEAVQLGRGERPPAADAAPFAVPGVSATAAVYRVERFLGEGGFEASYFAYYEDADLSLRLARSGARFACVPAARARHVGSATGLRRPVARWRRLFANRLRTLRRNLAPEARRALSRGAASSFAGAARELGWLRAGWALLAALVSAGPSWRRDARVLAARPPLARLPA